MGFCPDMPYIEWSPGTWLGAMKGDACNAGCIGPVAEFVWLGICSSLWRDIGWDDGV